MKNDQLQRAHVLHTQAIIYSTHIIHVHGISGTGYYLC